MHLQETPALVLRRQGSPVSVPTREIYYIESQNHIVQIHTIGEPITAYEQLASLMSLLPENFYCCHKSFIVNMNHIRHFQSSDILMKNGKLVPVSRARRIETREAYFSYMGRKL
jgi:two-component system LytT family response regulator